MTSARSNPAAIVDEMFLPTTLTEYVRFIIIGEEYLKLTPIDSKNALDYFQKAIDSDPSSALGYAVRAALYVKLKRPEEAIADYTRYLEMMPNDIRALTARRLLYIQVNNLELAERDEKTFKAARPDQKQHEEVFRAYHREQLLTAESYKDPFRDWVNKSDEFKDFSIPRQIELASVHFYLAHLAETKQQPGLLEYHLLQSQRIYPFDYIALSSLGLLAIQTAHEKAHEILSKATKVSYYPMSYFYMGQHYLTQNNIYKAQSYFDKALELAALQDIPLPTEDRMTIIKMMQPELYQHVKPCDLTEKQLSDKLLTLIRKKLWVEAQSLNHQAITLYPCNALLYESLAIIYYERRQLSKAKTNMHICMWLTNYTATKQCYKLLVKVNLLQGQIQHAIICYRNHYHANGIDTNGLDRIDSLKDMFVTLNIYAKISLQEDNVDTAISIYNEAYNYAITLEQQTELYSNRALAYKQAKMLTHAIEDYEQALQLDPENPVVKLALQRCQAIATPEPVKPHKSKQKKKKTLKKPLVTPPRHHLAYPQPAAETSDSSTVDETPLNTPTETPPVAKQALLTVLLSESKTQTVQPTVINSPPLSKPTPIKLPVLLGWSKIVARHNRFFTAPSPTASTDSDSTTSDMAPISDTSPTRSDSTTPTTHLSDDSPSPLSKPPTPVLTPEPESTLSQPCDESVSQSEIVRPRTVEMKLHPFESTFLSELHKRRSCAATYGGSVRDRYISPGAVIKDLDFLLTANYARLADVAHQLELTLIKRRFIEDSYKMAVNDDLNVDILSRKVDPLGLKSSIYNDFTCNALRLTLEGICHDITGRGFTDIEEKRLATVDDPFVAITRDPLLILRGIYFISKLEFVMEPNLYKAVQTLKTLVLKLDPAVINMYMLKMFSDCLAMRSYKQLLAFELLPILFPWMNHLTEKSILWLEAQMRVIAKDETPKLASIYTNFIVAAHPTISNNQLSMRDLVDNCDLLKNAYHHRSDYIQWIGEAAQRLQRYQPANVLTTPSAIHPQPLPVSGLRKLT